MDMRIFPSVMGGRQLMSAMTKPIMMDLSKLHDWASAKTDGES